MSSSMSNENCKLEIGGSEKMMKETFPRFFLDFGSGFFPNKSWHSGIPDTGSGFKIRCTYPAWHVPGTAKLPYLLLIPLRLDQLCFLSRKPQLLICDVPMASGSTGSEADSSVDDDLRSSVPRIRGLSFFEVKEETTISLNRFLHNLFSLLNSSLL